MVNVHARCNQVLPMRDAILMDDEVKRIGPTPGFQDEMLVEIFPPAASVRSKKSGSWFTRKNFRFR